MLAVSISAATHPMSAAGAGGAWGMDARTAELIGRYVGSPGPHRGAVLALATAGAAALPSPLLLLVADAALRGGELYTAGELFADVLARGETPWSGQAELGLGWIGLVQGDAAAARRHLEAAADEGALGAGEASLVPLALALIDAASGGGAASARALEHVAIAPETPTDLRMVARIGAAYARYWDDDLTGAAAAFESAALEYPGSPLADDARYGAAWARVRSSERSHGIEGLRALARSHAERRRGPSPARDLVELAPRAVLAAGLLDYRGPVVTSPSARLLLAIDLDGVRLARAALLLLRRGDDASLPTAHQAATAVTATADGTSAPERRDTPAHSGRASSLAAPGSGESAIAASRPGPAGAPTGAAVAELNDDGAISSPSGAAMALALLAAALLAIGAGRIRRRLTTSEHGARGSVARRTTVPQGIRRIGGRP